MPTKQRSNTQRTRRARLRAPRTRSASKPRPSTKSARSSTLKTQKTNQDVGDFLKLLPADRRRDCEAVSKLMQKVTGAKPKMWGPSIVGFGEYHYVYASGRTGDWPVTGFSPRKKNLTLYITSGFERFPELMQRLGKCKTAKSCLYIDSLADVDMQVLEKLVRGSVEYMKKRYPASS